MTLSINKPKKWDAEIIRALRAADKPLRTMEIVEQVLGGLPNKNFHGVFSAVPIAARRGLIKRVAQDREVNGTKHAYALNRDGDG